MTISEAVAAYRICAQAEGLSPKTVRWITTSVSYFCEFLGPERQDVNDITGNDLRQFIIAYQQSPKFLKHPFMKPQPEKLSPQSIQTYARAIRSFFSFLYREELIGYNPMEKVKMPRVSKKVVPTLSAKEVERLLAQPNRQTARGFRDYAIILTFIDTAARLFEIALLNVDDVDLANGYLKVLGKDKIERYIPFGHKVTKALLKYKLRYRPKPLGTERLWLGADGRPLESHSVGESVSKYKSKAGLKRCYPHKLRHTSSVLYLRNGGDPFSLQKKLGHSSLQMTRHYANLADSDVKAQHMKHGVADRLNT